MEKSIPSKVIDGQSLVAPRLGTVNRPLEGMVFSVLSSGLITFSFIR